MTQKKDTNAIIIKYSITSENKEPVKSDTVNKSKTVSDTTHKDLYHLPVNINNYSFAESEGAPEKPISTLQPRPSAPLATIYHPYKPVQLSPKDTNAKKHVLVKENYYVSFKPTYINAQLNDTYISNTYLPFSAELSLLYPGLGFNLSANGLEDLFEDYSISGGVPHGFGL